MKTRSFVSHVVVALALMLVTAGLLLSSLGTNAYAQQEPDRQLVQTNSPRVGSERRIALVIGNGAYSNAPPLKNPPNDARDMAATLKDLGFEVTSGVNVTQRELKQMIRNFGQKLKAGGSGLFYYAGHGLQSKGRNYLIPVDADLQSEAEVEDVGVDINLLLNYMDEAQNALNIVILDACRNNPFSRGFRSVSEGLAQVDAPTGTLIAYATAPGRVASDGVGQNGLYTSELLKQMRVPGLSVSEMFMHVRAEVMKRTGNKQVPWEASSLVGTFYFSPPKNSPGTQTSAVASVPRFDPAVIELSYWETIKNSNDPEDFKSYLEKYPSGQFVALARNNLRRLEAATRTDSNIQPSPTKNSDSNLTSATANKASESNLTIDAHNIKRFYKAGLAFDYPAAIELDDRSSPNGQHLVIQSTDRAQIMIVSRYTQINSAEQLAAARREVVDTFIETMWRQIHAQDPNVSRAAAQIEVAGVQATGVRLRAVLNNQPGNAEIYALQLGPRLVMLSLIGTDTEIAATASAWLAIRRSLKIEASTAPAAVPESAATLSGTVQR
jgi:uncharacterized caspase-like protein